MKKKYNLVFWLAMACLIYAVLSWFIPMADISTGAVQSQGVSPVGLFELVYYPIVTISYFCILGLVVLAIGGFYGVMSKTGVYSNLVEGLVQKVKGKEKGFLVVIVVTLAVLNSLLGIPFALLIVVPFLMAVILKLGYNKLTAVTATIGSILVGTIGSTFGNEIAGYFKNMMNVEATDTILWKIILLVLSVLLLIYFVLTTAKLNIKKTKKEKATKTTKSTKTSKTVKANTIVESKKEEKIVEPEEEILFLDEQEKSKKRKTLPIIIVFALTLFFAILSTYNWKQIFGIELFDSIYELVGNAKITKIFGKSVSDIPFLSNYNNMSIFTTILGVDNSFGNWNYPELIALLVIASLLIGWLYNFKIKDTFEGFISGCKRMIKPAIYVCLANTILTFTLYAGGAYSFYWVADKFLPSEFNVVSLFGTSLVGSLLCNDFYYVVYLFGQILSVVQYSTEIYPFIAFIMQAVHGILMLFLPTSVILVGGLSMLDVSYKDWIKHIWKLLVEILVVALVLFVIFAIALQV